MGKLRNGLGNVRDGLRRDDRSDDRVLCAGMCLERVTGGRMSRTGESVVRNSMLVVWGGRVKYAPFPD